MIASPSERLPLRDPEVRIEPVWWTGTPAIDPANFTIDCADREMGAADLDPEGSLAEQKRLERQVEEQTAINRALRERNAVLEREVLELQTGNRGVEQRAREQLGLVREGETFYQFVEKSDQAPEAGE